jgi:hypothetical protein
MPTCIGANRAEVSAEGAEVEVQDQNRQGEVRTTRLCARCEARAPRPPLHAEQLPGVEGVGRGGAVAGAPHGFARCYCVFLPSPTAQKGCLLKLRSASAAFVLQHFARGGRWLDLLFSSPRPFQGNAFCSGPALPPPSLLPACSSSSRQPRARRRACRRSQPRPPPRARPREKRCGRT